MNAIDHIPRLSVVSQTKAAAAAATTTAKKKVTSSSTPVADSTTTTPRRRKRKKRVATKRRQRQRRRRWWKRRKINEADTHAHRWERASESKRAPYLIACAVVVLVFISTYFGVCFSIPPLHIASRTLCAGTELKREKKANNRFSGTEREREWGEWASEEREGFTSFSMTHHH